MQQVLRADLLQEILPQLHAMQDHAEVLYDGAREQSLILIGKYNNTDSVSINVSSSGI